MPTVVATDNFNRANSTDLGTNWDVIFGTGHQITGNACACNTGSGAGWDGAELWNADTFDNDQYATCTISSAPGAGGATGLAVRASTNNFYGAYSDSFNLYAFKVVSGSFTTFNSSAALANGNTLRLEAEGTTVRSLVNGSLRHSQTDSAIASGAAGVSGYGTTSHNTIDD